MKHNPINDAKKYFESRVKNLPIGKCYITEDWKSEGLCQILITRNHNNGNVSYALFMVDITCLGVRDTIYNYNYSFKELQETILNGYGDLKFIECEYPLAHNIIYGALAFAEDLEIKPCKDWQISSQILEEDTEDIEFIDIEFGKDGKPFLSTTDPVVFQKYYNHLVATIGADNFKFIAPPKSF